jgi:hypothetical protein
MSEFPDLGFPYAVFHDFEGPQPAWILRKRFVFSDDSNNNNSNAYYPDPGAHPETLEFMSIIENPLAQVGLGDSVNTYFDMARVR